MPTSLQILPPMSTPGTHYPFAKDQCYPPFIPVYRQQLGNFNAVVLAGTAGRFMFGGGHGRGVVPRAMKAFRDELVERDLAAELQLELLPKLKLS